MADRTRELELDNQLCFAMYDATRAMVRAYGPLLAELGLTYPQYLTMLVLWEADAPVSVGDLGARLHLDSGTLSPLVKRLEHVGLVNRRRDPVDERRVLISLSAEGGALRTRACDVPARMAERFRLDGDAATKLREDLNRIVEILEPTPVPRPPDPPHAVPVAARAGTPADANSSRQVAGTTTPTERSYVGRASDKRLPRR